MAEQDIWPLIASVSGKNRKEVLLSMESPATPTVLAKRLKLHRSVVSRALLFMEKSGIAKCLNPKDKVQRYYTRTPLGNALCKRLKEIKTEE